MPIRTETDFRDGNGHLLEKLYDAVVEGVRDYYRDHPAVNHKHRTATRRSMTRDYIVHRLIAVFDGERGTEIVHKRGTTYFGMNSEFLGLVRKLSEKFRVALNDTQAAFDFQDNVAAPTLPGPAFAGATNLYLGYVPDARAPLNPKVYVVCPNSAGYEWVMELRREAGAVVVTAPVPPPSLDPEELVELVEAPKEEGETE